MAILLASKHTTTTTPKQRRRRGKPRTLNGADGLRQLGTGALKRVSIQRRIGRRNARRPPLTKRVLDTSVVFKPSLTLRTAEWGDSGNQDVSGAEVEHTFRTIDHLSPTGHGFSVIAGDDRRFLKQDHTRIYEGYSLNELVRLIVTVQEALDIVSRCRSQLGDDWLIAQGLDFGLAMDGTFIANYVHLLLRLRAELAIVLTRQALKALQRGRDTSSKPTPKALNKRITATLSTFPWNIKPSLAVLWGVCWMFYDRELGDQGKGGNRVRQDVLLQNLPWDAPASSDYYNLGLEMLGLGVEPHMQHATQQPSRDNVTAGLDGINTETWKPDLAFRLPSDDAGSSGPPMRFGQAPPQLSVQDHDHTQFYLPHNQGSPLTIFPWQNQSPHLRSPRHLEDHSQTPVIRVTGTGSHSAPPHHGFAAYGTTIYHQPQATPLQLDTTFDFNSTYTMDSQITPDTINTSMQVPKMAIKHERKSSVISNSNMPTPTSMSGARSPMLSPTSGERPQISTSPLTHSRQLSEDRSSQDGFGDEDGSLRRNFSFKRAEEPPRNEQGKMMCRYQECASLVFDRKCEWSKHMDKHDRPYKCTFKGCEKLQGFTYSGGLLRHEREVHKMHGGTKKSLYCPFHDCKRSSGAGFTRKENLAEHIRRVHRRTSMSADMHGLIIRRTTLDGSPIPEVQSRHTSESPYTGAVEYRQDDDISSLKRKRESDSVYPSDLGSADMRAEIKRLRHENEEKDSRLRQLEQAVMVLQQNARR